MEFTCPSSIKSESSGDEEKSFGLIRRTSGLKAFSSPLRGRQKMSLRTLVTESIVTWRWICVGITRNRLDARAATTYFLYIAQQ